MTGALYTHHEGHTHGIYTITSYRGHVAAAVHHLYVCPQVRLTALLQLRLEGSGARTHTLSLSYGHAHTHTHIHSGRSDKTVLTGDGGWLGSAGGDEAVCVCSVPARLCSARSGSDCDLGCLSGCSRSLCRRRRKSAETKLRSVFLRPQPDCQTKTHTRNIRSQPSK